MLTSGPGLPYPMLGLALLSSRTQSGSGMPLPLGLVSVLGGSAGGWALLVAAVEPVHPGSLTCQPRQSSGMART